MISAASVVKPPMWCPGRRESDLWRGCVLYLPFWERSGEKLFDLSGYSHNFQLDASNTVGWVASLPGNTLELSRVGFDDLITPATYPVLNNLGSDTNQFTLVTHLLVTSLSLGDLGLFTDWRTDTSHIIWRVDSTGTVDLYVSDGATKSSTTAAISVNTWYSLAGVADGYRVKQYINGLLADSGDTYSSITAGGGNVGIFVEDDGTETFYGVIGMFAAWSRVLSAGEIQALAADPYCMIRQPDFMPFWDVAAVAAVGYSYGVIIG